MFIGVTCGILNASNNRLVTPPGASGNPGVQTTLKRQMHSGRVLVSVNQCRPACNGPYFGILRQDATRFLNRPRL